MVRQEEMKKGLFALLCDHGKVAQSVWSSVSDSMEVLWLEQSLSHHDAPRITYGPCVEMRCEL